jgi:hypothetical protein
MSRQMQVIPSYTCRNINNNNYLAALGSAALSAIYLELGYCRYVLLGQTITSTY